MKSTESRIDLILGLPEAKRRYGYDHVKFFFPSGEAKSGAPLSPIISMFQLNITQVCKDLNELSIKSYLQGVILPAKIFKLAGSGKTSTYTIRLSSPSLKYYLHMALLSTINFENFGISKEMLESYQSASLSDSGVGELKLSPKSASSEASSINRSAVESQVDEISIPMPRKLPVTLLYDLLLIHSRNKTITPKTMSGSFFGSLKSMAKIRSIQLDC